MRSSRRYYRRRRRTGRRKYSKYRRFPRSTEVKSVAYQVVQSFNVNLTHGTGLDNVYWEEAPACMFVCPSVTATFGPEGQQHFITCCMNVPQGTGISERIGAKIKPIKFRLTGSINYSNPFYSAVANGSTSLQTIANETQLPRSFAVRLFVYQVRGGNSSTYPLRGTEFHPLGLSPLEKYDANWNPNCSKISSNEVKKLLGTYEADDERQTFKQLMSNTSAVKAPLRLGIGGQFRMLYHKVFYVSSTRPSCPFRIVTKVPRRLVWPEVITGSMNVDSALSVRNPIYCMWLVVPLTIPASLNISTTSQQIALFSDDRVSIGYQAQLFYTDS